MKDTEAGERPDRLALVQIMLNNMLDSNARNTWENRREIFETIYRLERRFTALERFLHLKFDESARMVKE